MERAEEKIVVANPHGLHARPAAIFVQIANKFDSSVSLERDGEVVDGKSIISILSLGISKGMAVKIITEGPDAQQALKELKEFLEREEDD